MCVDQKREIRELTQHLAVITALARELAVGVHQDAVLATDTARGWLEREA